MTAANTDRTRALVRQLLSQTDHLSRVCHVANDTGPTWRLASLRTALQRIERHLAGASPRFMVAGELDVVYQRIRDVAAHARGETERAQLQGLLARAESLHALPARRRGGRVRARGAWWVMLAGAVGLLLPLAVLVRARWM